MIYITLTRAPFLLKYIYINCTWIGLNTFVNEKSKYIENATNASAKTINLVSWTTTILAYVYSCMEAQVNEINQSHYSDDIMSAMASQISSLTIVYSTVYSGADQRKHKSSASLVFVRGIHRWPVNSPHKAPVTRKMFPYGDVIMIPQFTFVTLSTSDVLGLYNFLCQAIVR